MQITSLKKFLNFGCIKNGYIMLMNFKEAMQIKKKKEETKPQLLLANN